MRPSRTLVATLLLGSALIALPVQAEPSYNQISLRAEASLDVPHDEMQVNLYTEAQDKDPGKLASRITQTLNEAVAKARTLSAVRVSLGSRSSYPVYDQKGQITTAWRERAELRLESSDFAALSKLVADLLDTLQMSDMNFSIANASRKTAEDALLKEAIQRFNERANMVSTALGGKGFRVVTLNLNSGGIQPMMRMNLMSGAAEAAAPNQSIEAGSSRVTVSADGVIEVSMP